MAGVMYRLDHRGHGKIAEWSDDRISIAEAKRVFKEHQNRHYTMADITQNDGVFMKRFDPEVREILAIPQMVAG